MFDLEQSIADWRKQMLAAGIQAPVPLDELENHLREEIERQMKSGLNLDEPEAFDQAVRKIGRPEPLENEFKKIGGLDKARQRWRVGFIYAAIFSFYAFFVIVLLCKNDLTLNERLLGFAAVVVALLANYAAWRFTARFFPVITSHRLQSAIGLVGGISGMLWFFAFAYLILPRCNLTSGQLLVALLWALVPVLLLPALIFLGLERSEPPSFTSTNSQAKV